MTLPYRITAYLAVAAATVALCLWGCCPAKAHDAPQGEPLVEQVDLIEVNAFFDEKGRLVFEQLIFLDWHEDEVAYRVRSWRLIKTNEMYPQRNAGKGWVVRWHDGEVFRIVTAPSRALTHTQYDPELHDREKLHKEQRRELRPRLNH